MTIGTAKKMDRKNWNTYRSVDEGGTERAYQIRRRKGGEWEARILLGGKVVIEALPANPTEGELRYQDAKRRQASIANIDDAQPADMLAHVRAEVGDSERKPPQVADDDPLPTWAVGDTRDAQAEVVEDSHEIMILH